MQCRDKVVDCWMYESNNKGECLVKRLTASGVVSPRYVELGGEGVGIGAGWAEVLAGARWRAMDQAFRCY